jgi:DNA helicase II / ATP-dependent DNA helicase PcrA
MDAPAKPPTEEQSAIYDAARASSANLMIEALAGTGKTHTLEHLVPHLGRSPCLYLVFNKKNADEAKAKMPYNVEVRTLNSIGYRCWSDTIYKPRLAMPKSKTYDIFKEITNAAGPRERTTLWATYDAVRSGVDLAKALGYAPPSYPQAAALIKRGAFHAYLDESPDDLVADLIDEVLTRSIRLAYAGTVDFNDQVYMPAMFKATCPKYPVVLVDEYQDLSPTNHALLAKLAQRRLIGVGDPYQNIYGFRGAKAGGMEEAVACYAMDRLPLSVSFRCPSEIVKSVQWHVPSFRWNTEGGRVELPTNLPADDIVDDSVVLCRNNAPLLAMAVRFITHGRSVNLAGSDIGARLIAVMRKLGDESLSGPKLLGAITEWLDAKLAAESKTASDLAECMRVFAERSADLGQAIRYAEHLFAQQGKILFSTGHKAKGLEWDTVVHLDPWLCRRKATPQSKNLDYVISTRSKNRLIEIDSECITW